MQFFLLFLVAVIAGLMLPVQAGLNAELGRVMKSPVLAAIVSFVVGTIALIAYALIARIPLIDIKQGFYLPWYYWVGGALGAFYVYALVDLTPKLGVALFFGITVAAQMTISLIMDHYGWLGVPKSPINWMRVLGVVLIIGGVVMIRVTQ